MRRTLVLSVRGKRSTLFDSMTPSASIKSIVLISVMVEFLLGEAMTATLMGSRHLVSQLEVANQLLIGSLAQIRRASITM